MLQLLRANLQVLLNDTPAIISALGKEFNNLAEEFKTFAKIPTENPQISGLPVLTIAFCGPSGAGKSTLFNCMTNLKVPAGGATRPMTHASLAVFPPSDISPDISNRLFPGFQIEKLFSPQDLRNPSAPNDRLYITNTELSGRSEDFFPCLIDIPDFNTTAVSNWEKAEQMIKRADSIIFTVSCESYKNKVTFEILHRILKLSGSVIYLLTKLSPENSRENAHEIREDLIASVKADPDFAHIRTDGTSLIDFLRAAPFFFSPFSVKPELNEILSLNFPETSFTDYIFGQKGNQILMSRQKQVIAAGISCTEKILLAADQVKQDAQALENKTHELLQISATRITGEEFPVFHILAMIRRMIEQNRPNILKRAFQPLLFIGSGIKKVISTLHSTIKTLGGKKITSDVKLRNDLERNRLNDELEELIDNLRLNPDIPDFSTELARQAAHDILKIDLPPVDSDWESSVNASLLEWQKDNKNLWLWLNVINDVFILLGTGLFVADLFIDGGMGTLGVVAVIGGSSATGGFLLSLFNNMGLGRQVLQAHNQWKIMRQKAYTEHLATHFAGPLFLNSAVAKNREIKESDLQTCREACEKLKEIIVSHDQQSA